MSFPTLPEDKRRHWLHVGDDSIRYFVELLTVRSLLSRCGLIRSSFDETSETATATSTSSLDVNDHPQDDDDDDDDDEWEEDLKILDSKDFAATATLMATRDSRASYTEALHRPSNAFNTRRSSILSKDIEKAVSYETTPLNPRILNNFRIR